MHDFIEWMTEKCSVKKQRVDSVNRLKLHLTRALDRLNATAKCISF